MKHLADSAIKRGEQVSQILRIAIRDIVMSDPGVEDYLLGTCVVNGVPHHAEFIRVHDVEDEDGRQYRSLLTIRTVATTTGRTTTTGHYQTMKVPGFEGDWAMVIFPYA